MSVGRSLGYALNGVRQSKLAYDPATGRLASMLAAGSDTPFKWNYLASSDLKSALAYPNPQRRRLYNTGRRLIWSGEGLDGGYPYDTGGIVTDSPGTTLLPCMNVVAVNDSFKMHLMFKPDVADAIWVPLKLVAWGWSAEVSRQGDSWTLVSNSNPEPEVHDTSQHPVWNRDACRGLESIMCGISWISRGLSPRVLWRVA